MQNTLARIARCNAGTSTGGQESVDLRRSIALQRKICPKNGL
jgi:hypothetical protein